MRSQQFAAPIAPEPKLVWLWIDLMGGSLVSSASRQHPLRDVRVMRGGADGLLSGEHR